MKRPANVGRLASELAGLSRLDREALTERWKQLYGRTPPHYSSLHFLMHGIAQRLQEEALGGLKSSTRRMLMEAADTVKPSPVIKPGTRLLREWRGITYEAIIRQDGVQYKGQCYQSLSEVARAITGNRWSGPLFFGLKKRTS